MGVEELREKLRKAEEAHKVTKSYNSALAVQEAKRNLNGFLASNIKLVVDNTKGNFDAVTSNKGYGRN